MRGPKSLAHTGLAILAVVLVVTLVTDCAPDPSTVNADDVTAFHTVPESSGGVSFSPAFDVIQPGSSISPVVVVARIALDDDYLDRFTDSDYTRIDQMVAMANEVLKPVGVRIQIAGVTAWKSDEADIEMRDLLASADEQAGRPEGELLIAVTCQDTVRYDGLAQSHRGRLILQYRHSDAPKNAALLAHELGHLLGAADHEKDPECTGPGCIMDGAGYEHIDTWCDHHIEVMQAALADAIQA